MTEGALAGGKLIVDRPAEAVARLRLNNPEKRNPLDHDVLDALAAILPELGEGIETRCVIVTGTGEAFSAGYDIGAISDESFEHDAEALVAHPFQAAMEAVSAHRYPVVAAINGHCLGGGLELAIRCDIRICAAGAKLGMPPAKLGLVYGHTGLERFIDAIGVAYTRELFLTGRNIGAERADAIGLVHEVVADDELEEASIALAAEIASNAPLSITGNKHVIETLTQFPRLTEEQERELIELREAVLRLRGLPRGPARVRGEAQARVARALIQPASWIRSRLPAGSRKAQSRTPYG